MPTNSKTYGVLRFQQFDQFIRIAPEVLLQAALASLGGPAPRPPAITDWPRITESIRRGSRVLLTAETPSLRASLDFDPEVPDAGSYEVHFPRERRHDKGSVLTVRPVEDDDLRAMLASFPFRYTVTTASSTDRQRTQQIWLVGISSFREVNPSELDQ